MMSDHDLLVRLDERVAHLVEAVTGESGLAERVAALETTAVRKSLLVWVVTTLTGIGGVVVAWASGKH
jgi:hypothetical protein